MAKTVDQMLLHWLEETPGIPRRERQALLLKELMAVHSLRGLAFHQGASEENQKEIDALAERETNLCAALRNTLLEAVDVAEARRVAECICDFTDLDFLYRALDAHCIMSLRVMGDGARQPPLQLRGVDDIISELSEFQESVLLLRVDSATLPARLHDSNSSNNIVNQPMPRPIAVRSVSSVQSWVVQCEVELEVGTQMTYYANADRTTPLFDLRSSFVFSADGAKVERISRELLPRGGHHADDLLRVLHFGYFHL
ncbi:hypothetical protein N2W54_005811 [Lotmaria passim]